MIITGVPFISRLQWTPIRNPKNPHTQRQIFRNTPRFRNPDCDVLRPVHAKRVLGQCPVNWVVRVCKVKLSQGQQNSPETEQYPANNNNNKPCWVTDSGIARSSSRPAMASCSRARNSAAGSDSGWPKVLSSKASIEARKCKHNTIPIHKWKYFQWRKHPVE